MILERIDKRASILIIAILVFLYINRILLLHILKWHYESIMYERRFEIDLELLLSTIIVFLLIFISIRSTQIHEKLVFSGLALWFCISLFEVFIEKLIPSLFIHVLSLIIGMFILHQIILFYKKVQGKRVLYHLLILLACIASFILAIFSVFIVAKF